MEAKNHFNYASVTYSSIQDYDEALKQINSAIDIADKDRLLFDNRGATYKQMGDLEKAIEDYSHAIELAPNIIWSYELRADAYFDAHKYEEALADYNEIIRLNDLPSIQEKPSGDKIRYVKKQIDICDDLLHGNFIDRITNQLKNVDELMIFFLVVISFNYIVELVKNSGNFTLINAIKGLIGKGILLFFVLLAGALESKFQLSYLRDIILMLVLLYEFLYALINADSIGIPVPAWLIELVKKIIKWIEDSLRGIVGRGTNNQQS